MAGLLLPPGKVVLTTIEPGQMVKVEDGVSLVDGMLRMENSSAGGDRLAGVPVVVITDETSGGSAAIVAAAWRAHHRATVIGERATGTGGVLQWFGVVGVAAVQLPTGRMLAADGRPLAEASTPDVAVDARRPLTGRREDDAALRRAVEILRGSP